MTFLTQKVGLIEELYEILGEQVHDQLGRIFKPSKKAPPTKLLKVQQKDFDGYILKIRKVKIGIFLILE
jgi:hypothetical protein